MREPVLLPCADHYPGFLDAGECAAILQVLREAVPLTPHVIRMADGSVFESETSKCMFVDGPVGSRGLLSAAYGKQRPCPDTLFPVRGRIEAIAGRRFQVCVAIAYPDGDSSMGYHSDPPAFGDTSVIASLSLGATRTFALRSRVQPEDVRTVDLVSGDLVVMTAGCQERFEHALLPDPSVRTIRYNLTFRSRGDAVSP